MARAAEAVVRGTNVPTMPPRRGIIGAKKAPGQAGEARSVPGKRQTRNFARIGQDGGTVGHICHIPMSRQAGGW